MAYWGIGNAWRVEEWSFSCDRWHQGQFSILTRHKTIGFALRNQRTPQRSYKKYLQECFRSAPSLPLLSVHYCFPPKPRWVLPWFHQLRGRWEQATPCGTSHPLWPVLLVQQLLLIKPLLKWLAEAIHWERSECLWWLSLSGSYILLAESRSDCADEPIGTDTVQSRVMAA